jgi:hypothetical protein
MNSTNANDPSTLSMSLLEGLVALCEDYEKAWKSGRSPRLEDYLERVEDPDRTVALRHLLIMDLELREDAGQVPHPSEYEARFPGQADLIRTVIASLREPRAGPYAGKYELLRPLGEGGQAAAWLARDPDCSRLVVLKRYHTPARGLGADEALQDGKALARLRSRFVPQCYGLERHDDELILVMEYIPGRTLSEINKSQPPALGVAARLVEQVAEGLEAVHACGLLHRDIKPANIVLGDDGVPRLVDFGLATHLGSAALGRTVGHAVVHGARAGPSPVRADRSADRRLWPGGGPLRALDRPAAPPRCHLG